MFAGVHSRAAIGSGGGQAQDQGEYTSLLPHQQQLVSQYLVVSVHSRYNEERTDSLTVLSGLCTQQI